MNRQFPNLSLQILAVFAICALDLGPARAAIVLDAPFVDSKPEIVSKPETGIESLMLQDFFLFSSGGHSSNNDRREENESEPSHVSLDHASDQSGMGGEVPTPNGGHGSQLAISATVVFNPSHTFLRLLIEPDPRTLVGATSDLLRPPCVPAPGNVVVRI